MKSILCFLLATTAFASVHAQPRPEVAEATYRRAVERFRNGELAAGLIILDSAIVALRHNEMYDQLIYAENDGVMAREELGASPIESFAGYERIIRELLPKVEPGAMHAKTYFDFGALCYQLGEHVKALNYLQKAERIMVALGDKLKLERAYVFDTMSSVAEAMGSHEQNKMYGVEALSIISEMSMYDHPFGIILRVNLFLSLLKSGDYDEAEPYLTELLALFPHIDPNDFKSRAAILYAESEWLEHKGDFEQAYQRLITVERDYPDRVRSVGERIRMISKKANLSLLTGRFIEAERMLLNALSDSNMVTLRASIYSMLSTHYIARGEPSLAVKYAALCQKMMVIDRLHEVKSMNDFSGGVMAVLKAMTASVAALEALADSSGSRAHWQDVLEAVQHSEKVFAMMRRKARVGELLRLREAGWFNLYESGMRAAYILHQQSNATDYLSAAWNISEYAKSAVLLSSVNRATPDTVDVNLHKLIRKEIDLKTKISYLESLQAEEGAAFDQGFVMVKLNLALDSVIWLYEIDFPEYALRRFSPATATLNEAQKYAEEQDTGIFAYFFGERFVFAMSVQPDKVLFEMLDDPQVLVGLIGQYRNLLNQRPVVQGFTRQLEEVNRLGFELYTRLIKSLTDPEGLRASTLILPDGPLNYVPFEALPVSNRTDMGAGSYLVHHTDISYAYGFTSLRVGDFTSRSYEQKLLALAPQFGGAGDQTTSSKAWIAIPGAQLEIDLVSRLFRPHIARNSVSNYDWFMEHKGSSELIHLATHAFVDEKDPFRSGLLLDGGPHAGEEGVLYSADLYHLSIPASLVVLSACNTGSGPVKRGEGVVSLAHGFSYAGSASVVMTLWPANDKTTAELIGHFYEALSDGASKSRALNEAKRSYLRGADAYQSHPYFWAGMVLIGDVSPLEAGGVNAKLWWLALAVTALLLVFILVIRHRRRRRAA